MTRKDSYDVIIIGAGIGGLVCGCYLAKAGMKVLIIEQHTSPGGYCSSFKRKGFSFDSSIHYLKFTKGNGLLDKIIEDFKIKSYIKFKRLEPSDLIITPAGEFYVSGDVNKTVDNLINLFPQEDKNIQEFFDFLGTENVALLYSKTRDKTLWELIRWHFKNKGLISIFNSLLMNIGLPINRVDALKAYFFFKEFFFNESHYPEGGMQKFSDALAKFFRMQGGVILYSSKASKILVEGSKCIGVSFNDKCVYATYVVSNADPYNTFFNLLGKNKMSRNLRETVKNIVPSMSAFIVYMGLSNEVKRNYPINSSVWYFPSPGFNKVYDSIEKKQPIKNDDYLICSFPSSYDKTLAPEDGVVFSVFSGASFNNKKYWEENREKYANIIIERAKVLFPNILDCIKVVSVATPHTLHSYTSNYSGACYGLASIRQQMRKTFMPQKTEIENLFMAGHWTTHGIGQGGVSMAAFSGASAAKIVLKTNKRG